MTTLRQIELRCPVCDNEFKSQSVVSTNAFGGKRTDFHERAAGTQPLAYLIHMCSECGYSGGEMDFTGIADVGPVLKQHVLMELTPPHSSSTCGSEKYEAAAKVAQWQGMDSRYVADLLLRALVRPGRHRDNRFGESVLGRGRSAAAAAESQGMVRLD